MKRLAWAALLLLAFPIAGEAQDMNARLDRLAQWLKAVMRHEPGTADDPAATVSSWSSGQVRTLWIDTNVLVQLTLNPKGVAFSVRPEGQTKTQPVRYTASEFTRLRSLACAAGGRLAEPLCSNVVAIDRDLALLSTLVAAARLRGDHNYILRRGALLHADIAMLTAPPAEPVRSEALAAGPRRVRLQIADGREIDISQIATHWELARMLLDYVKPRDGDRPAPGRDTMVRDWYRATAAWMQSREDHDTVHLDRARDIFPNDPAILFLSGCQRETYASPGLQTALQAITIAPHGMTFDVESGGAELRHAESFFRRAIAAAPQMAEAHLRFGHVLLRLERFADAAAELRLGLGSTDDALLRYYGQLFLGASEEMLGNVDAARAAFTEAAALYPSAQSPGLALSALARRRGDRDGALRELRRVFDLPREQSDRDDPWWTYYVAQARNADDLLAEMRRPFVHAEVKR